MSKVGILVGSKYASPDTISCFVKPLWLKSDFFSAAPISKTFPVITIANCAHYVFSWFSHAHNRLQMVSITIGFFLSPKWQQGKHSRRSQSWLFIFIFVNVSPILSPLIWWLSYEMLKTIKESDRSRRSISHAFSISKRYIRLSNTPLQ